MNKLNYLILGLSENSKKIIADILITLSFILFVLSVYNTKIATIPYFVDFGLIEVLPITFPLAIILLLVSILINIEKMSEFKYIVLLILLTEYIWGIRAFVVSYAFAHDAWAMGYIANKIIEAGNFSIADQYKPAMYYIGWPGSFVYLTIMVKTTGLKIIDILKIYPLIISPILFYSIYTLFRTLSKNQLISRYAALFFLIVNSFIYIHWSPQSLSLILFIILILLMKKIEKSAHSFILPSLIFMIIFSIIIIHPTMSLILIIFLICINSVIIYKIYKDVFCDTLMSLNFLTSLTLMSIVLFIFWTIYMSEYNFSVLIKETFPHLTNFFTTEKISSFAVGKVSSQTIGVRIRSLFFTISFLITICYLAYTFIKKKEIKLYETGFIMVAIALYFIDINLTKGGYFERIPMMAYLSISLVFGLIYVNLNKKKQFLKYTFILFLLVTFTFYDHDILDLYSESVINGYSFSLSSGYGKSAAISADTYTIAEPFLILNNPLFFGEDARFKDINLSIPIQNYYIISDSNSVRRNFYTLGQIDRYDNFLNSINNSFLRIYDNTAITVYLNPTYVYSSARW